MICEFSATRKVKVKLMRHERCGSIGNLRVSGLAFGFSTAKAFLATYLISDNVDTTVPRNSNDGVERTEIDTHDRHAD